MVTLPVLASLSDRDRQPKFSDHRLVLLGYARMMIAIIALGRSDDSAIERYCQCLIP